jgi:chromosome segregation protein
MRLERLEISGFKSFSDRSELSFDKGVTAIVGPNGCGKSNLADAITWVMGEQSARSLRGDRMEDVIFSGSDVRKPTATAEVRLRFTGVVKSVTGPPLPVMASAVSADGNRGDRGSGHGFLAGSGGNGHGNGRGNPDVAGDLDLVQAIAREVEVTRRLYRSGESEYLIDGQACRLRDIHDLLMDTGLGAKAYAIIEQGKIGLILSSRPTDRRQLIEEAAGITKYKARRRSAELKLEGARQNLTRIDDIVFEVDRQRGALKRQAAKASRYRRLREELRRAEKVLFARKYRQLAATIEATGARLRAAREREATSQVEVAALDAELGRIRIELIEAESRATAAREAAHAQELALNRRQQQIAFDKEQIQLFGARATAMAEERESLIARCQPARTAAFERHQAARDAEEERERAAAELALELEAYEAARRQIEGLEADVEAARSEVFSAINAATALRHALEHAAAARERALEQLAKLQVEGDDIRVETERMRAAQAEARCRLQRARGALEATELERLARVAELENARAAYDRHARAVREQEHDLARLDARLKSLEELEAARAEYGDAARTVLAQANGRVNQRGALADYVEVRPGYERAVEACLGQLLEHVLVERPEHAAAGLNLVREQSAGRCGFVIASADSMLPEPPAVSPAAAPGDMVALSSVVRVNGPFAPAIQRAIGEAWIAGSYEQAETWSRSASAPVATLQGELFRGPLVVTGGSPQQARGILGTKREIRDLGQRVLTERAVLQQRCADLAAQDRFITKSLEVVARLDIERHDKEKAIVGLEAQIDRDDEDAIRLSQRADQVARERLQVEAERDALDARQEEAQNSIIRLERDQHDADERLAAAQRQLFAAREAAEALSRRAADRGAAHAALIERASALASEARRLDEAAAELEVRGASLGGEVDAALSRLDELRRAVDEGELDLDAGIHTLERLRSDVESADGRLSTLRIRADERELALKTARSGFDSVRQLVSAADVARARAESDLAHLSDSCVEAVQATLDEVVSEVSALERTGALTPDAPVVCADDGIDLADDEEGEGVREAGPRSLSAEDAIANLRGKIDRLGPVNMMAIEQFDELETRHAFLTAQRQDLVDSIEQTSEAIRRIDETTRQRFAEAFSAINANFQQTFSTLFGGGRAGLALIDDNDPLESGIEIVAQPPGKRLQSVQLLSGGEKALTAIALMFGLFKYKPSPFCLLDEIDAPLDDANIGRFVQMLRGMQEHTQFILITHNRKTMEIADRLYGVTMEEPGVSKLISVRLP